MAHCGLAGGRGHDGRSRRIKTRQPKGRARGASEREFACAPLLSCEAQLRRDDCGGEATATARLRQGGGSSTAAAGQSRRGTSSTTATKHRRPTPLPTHSTRHYLGNHPFCAHGFAAKPPLVGGSPSAEPPPLRKRLGQYCESVRRGGAPNHSGVTRRGHVRIQAFMSRRKSWSARQTR